MRIVTWNVDSIRARLAQVLDWVDAKAPDILCLQETKCRPIDFPAAPFEERGYLVVAHGGDGGRAGVAVLSRLTPGGVVLGVPGAVPPLDEPRSISFTAAGLRVHTCYAPNGRKVGTPPHRIKLAWFELFGNWLTLDSLAPDRDRPEPTLLVGDLNIAPCDIDIWEPARYRRRNLTSKAEREAFAALIDRGLIDIVRDHHGEDAVFTWWNRRSDFYETDRGWRLDHALASPDVAAAVDSVMVDRDERARQPGTDHAPLVVDLDWPS